MFSGGDSSEGMNSLNQFNTYGFVNQAAVTNAMAAGQNIDWAQLAQQWIQMRDNTESELKEAPSPPNISFAKNEDIPKRRKFEEKGEADMDMDDEEQTDEKTSTKTDSRISNASVIQQHNIINQQWFIDQASTTANIVGSQMTARSLSSHQWNTWANRDGLPQASNQPNISNRATNPTAHIPSLLKITVPHPNEIRAMPDTPNQQDSTFSMMDAAKRKGLPAWIREGLEKMEREKLKQMEKQHNEDDRYSSEEDSDLVKSPKNMVMPLISKNNNCNEDEESTDNEAIAGENSSNNIISLKSRDDHLDYGDTGGKSYEQKLADLMIVVRRTLTELLLEVTNEEIYKVADATVKSFKSKASSAQVIRKSALSTITGKLGLAAYGDSSTDETSDDDEQDSGKKTIQSESDNDSEEEIKNNIRSKRRAFAKISEEIEERVASAATREEEKLKYFLRKEEEDERENKRKNQERSQSRDPSSSGYSGHSVGKGYERDNDETTETRLQHLNGKRQKDRSARRERTTRFSDNKDKKYLALAATATFISNMNAKASSGTAGSSNTTPTPTLAITNQRQVLPDVNGLLPNYNAGITSALNAADAALEKALKRKTSQSPEKHSRRRNRDRRDYSPSKKRQRRGNSKDSRSQSSSSSSSTSSTSSSSSTDSDSSSTRSSHNSKYNDRSTTKHNSHRSYSKKSERSPRDHRDERRDDRKYSSTSSSYAKRDHESSSSRYRRRVSSDSDDDYSRRKYDSHYSRNSSHSRTHTSSSSRRDRRDHSRSRSRSSYSSSSNRRK